MADKEGLANFSMRKLAAKLKVEPMSLYHHYKNKEALLGDLIGVVFSEMGWPDLEGDFLKMSWQEAMRIRAKKFREALLKHQWAINLLDSTKKPSQASFHHHESVLTVLDHAGFSVLDAAHAFALLDSYIYGFVVQERTIPASQGTELRETYSPMMTGSFEVEFPKLFRLSQQYVFKDNYSFSNEFPVGLEMIIQALELKLKTSRAK